MGSIRYTRSGKQQHYTDPKVTRLSKLKQRKSKPGQLPLFGEQDDIGHLEPKAKKSTERKQS